MNKIAIVDDHKIIVDSLKMLIENLNLGEVHTFYNGRSLFSSNEIMNFEIAILDFMLPDYNGFELIARLQKVNPKIKIIVMTSQTDSNVLLKLHQLGINGFLPKSVSQQKFKQAIESIKSGENFFSEPSFNDIIVSSKPIEKEEEINLTSKELEIIELLNNFYNNAEIADELSVSENTVKYHKKKLYRLFSVTSAKDLIKAAKQRNLI